MEFIGRDRGGKDCKKSKAYGGAGAISEKAWVIWRWEGRPENRPNLNETLWLIRREVEISQLALLTSL
jgi:hypothetical protein